MKRILRDRWMVGDKRAATSEAVVDVSMTDTRGRVEQVAGAHRHSTTPSTRNGQKYTIVKRNAARKVVRSGADETSSEISFGASHASSVRH